ncbi:Acyl-CoA-binding protein [Merluccius polli]|uniref:Acyl-CoA-binding protein n=1 Tax=Merluccius polli TaxID=89951 RepID=A0AA47MJZ8_MERPO|nr:Acyl-CoA-binding protein [Merluccius polli]
MQCDRFNHQRRLYKPGAPCAARLNRIDPTACRHEEAFLRAVEEAKVLKERPSVADLGVLYGLYKQATEGNVGTERPGILDFVGRKKWDAWKSREGLTKQEAMESYIKAVEGFKEKYGI